MDNLYLFILLALAAEILGTLGGFGSSMLFVPIAGLFLDFYSVLGITAIFHLASNISKIVLFREGFDKKLVLKMGIPAVIAVGIGASISSKLNTQFLEYTLAFFLIFSSLILFIKKEFHLKPNATNAIGGGIFSGLIAGLLGTGGAIRGLVLAAYGLSTSVFIASSAIIDLAVDLTRTVVYWQNDYIHQHDIYLIPILFVVSIIGTFIAKKILKRIPETYFRKFVLVLIFVSGIIIAVKPFI